MVDTPIHVPSKLDDVGTTIFSVIAELSDQHKAINLAQGAPSFDCDPRLIELTHEAMRRGDNQYSPMAGVLALRQQVSDKIAQLYQHRYRPEDEVLITASASQGLYIAISALVHAGDEVIYLEPCFDSYAPIVRMQGATPIGIKLKVPDFSVDWQQVAEHITPKTRMIILNSPHNPTGMVFSQQDLECLNNLTKNSNILILSDEVYEHTLFDNKKHLSMSTHKELAQRSVVVTSFGKTFHVTGWRVGCCVAPEPIMKELMKVHQFLMFAADTPMQYAFSEYLKEPEHYLGLAQLYQKKRDLMLSLLEQGPFKALPSAGSFFVLLSYGHLSQEADSEIVKRLIQEAGVATIPLSAFYSDSTDNKFIRLAFCKKDEEIIRGVEALNAFKLG
ncbi:methionine aminotransferase [Reinekea thalattae]|uniref:Aminotransferase class I/II-fold pyridoxal phosphate-dependent enzyme n=1 Tax=Reinekea thalattae TaxID=2593301 RepID=A0A5C8Z2W7_9GAMM|nr:methionine aminotransferase [Reinekea thalattae]TXR51897.1 aminotransferase class I/II-fold pyridoxal phosphate-dependent enzyme [Reinekea thalattae]